MSEQKQQTPHKTGNEHFLRNKRRVLKRGRSNNKHKQPPAGQIDAVTVCVCRDVTIHTVCLSMYSWVCILDQMEVM